MLTLVYGTDTEKRARKVREIANADGALRFSADDLDIDAVVQLAASSGLFSEPETVVLTGLFETDETKEFLLDNAVLFASSPNHFIVSETKALKKELAVFNEAGAEILEYKAASKGKEKPLFNIFSLTDAMGARDNKKLWLLFQDAIEKNTSPEEIQGILWWQVKNMMSVMQEKKNPGLHPFVYGKVQKFIKNFSLGELRGLGSWLVHLFHDVRRGKRDLKRELEKLILSL